MLVSHFFPVVYTLYAKLTSCSFTCVVSILSSGSQQENQSFSFQPIQISKFSSQVAHLGFLKVFCLLDLTHNKPCLNWMFSFCTFKTACISILHPQDSCSDTESTRDLWSTLHTSQSTCNMYLLCHTNVYSIAPMMFSYILFHDIIKWILSIYDDFSQMSRIDAHWLLTPVLFFLFFFSYLICVCRNCHRSCCKWCLLTNCVLVLLLFDSVYSLDLLQSDLCD